MSRPTLKMTHGAIGEAMCCYTDGSYKDADIALTEYENSIRADARAKTIDECINAIDDEYYDGGYGTYHDVEMVVRMLKNLKEQK